MCKPALDFAYYCPRSEANRSLTEKVRHTLGSPSTWFDVSRIQSRGQYRGWSVGEAAALTAPS